MGDSSLEEEEIETRCDELRQKLLADLEKQKNSRGGGPVRKHFKSHQVHEMADAKIKESERLRSALRISKDYEEGSHWRRQEERLRNAVDRDTKKEEAD